MKRSRSIIALLLVAVMAFGFAAPAGAATQSEADAHQQNAAEARKKAAAAEEAADKLLAETAELDKQIDALQDKADALEPQINDATSRTNRLRAEVDGLKGEVTALQREIDETQAEYKVQQGLLADRVEASYKQGQWFYFDILLGSQDFDDLISRTELVTRVIESNNNIAAGLADTRDNLTRSRVELDRTLEAVNLRRKEAEAVQKKLVGLQSERQAAVNAQEAIYDKKSDLMAENKANAKRLRALAESEERESARIEAELSGSGSGYFDGEMAWPVPGFTRVSSPYGWRICPFHGREFHPGIDIGRKADGTAINGAAIVATGGGTVIYAGYRGGYGNTVMVDHGNGVVTLYAHQQSGGIKVGVGQKVSKGQRIGTVGSTGYSTGPHLHFEVRVNGQAKSPASYL